MTTPQQPGWYDDPHDPNAQRYWDGQDWTPHRQRKPIARPTQPPPPAMPTQPPPPPPGLPPPPDQQPQWPPPGGGPPQRSRTPTVIGAVIGGVAVLAVAGVLGYKFVLPAISSPEDQIRAVVKAFTDDYNNADAAKLLTLICDRSKGDLGSSKGLGFLKSLGVAYASDELRQKVDESGTAATSVTDIRVTGDRATATLTTTFSKSPSDNGSETDSFAKENGSWKICFPPDNSG
jgi:hypothetical protein